MLFIRHRVNTIRDLEQVPVEEGVELDIRDQNGRLILHHDPLTPGEDFEAYLRRYRHAFMILNTKTEGLEGRILDLIKEHGIRDYFFLDLSFPALIKLARAGENRIAVRFSEFEPLDQALALAGKVGWVWIDCFTHLPLDEKSHAALKQHFKLCIVSPELQAHPLSMIGRFREQLRRFPVDAICTKRPDLWI